MANQLYQRFQKRGKFLYTGIDIRHPPDLLPPGKAPLLVNVTPDTAQGSISARPAITKAAQLGTTPINALGSRNDGSESDVFAGDEAGKLWVSPFGPIGPYTDLVDGFSGRPVAFVPYRPPQSASSWMYVFDQNQMRKVTTPFSAPVGIAAPRTPPATALFQPFYTRLQNAFANPAGWVVSGDAGAVSSSVRTSLTVREVLYDNGSTGWCSVAATSSTPLSLGQNVIIGFSGNPNTEETTVEQVFAGANTLIEVAGFAFDSGSVGLVTVMFDKPVEGIRRNALITINSVYCRVLSATAGPDGRYSIRTFMPLSGIISIGSIVSFPPSFRCFTVNSHVNGEPVVDQVLESTLTYPTPAPLQSSGLIANIEPFDLSFLPEVGVAPGGVTAPLTPDDYMHVSFAVTGPDSAALTAIQEVHFLLDVDPATVDISTAFTKNYFYYVVRQGDFTAITEANPSSALSSLFNTLGNTIAANPPSAANVDSTGSNPYPAVPSPNYSLPDPAQMQAGLSQWFEATFHLSELTRVGTDDTLSLAGVTAIGVRVIYTEPAAGDTLTIQFGNWWVGGGFGPDSNFNSYGNQGTELLYRYRYRSTTSGAYSDVSPATRSGELSRRQGVIVTVPTSADGEVDLIDIERFGGSNTATGWHRVLTIENGAGSIDDTVTEAAAAAGLPLETGQYQPWPVTGRPQAAQVNIAGTRVTQSLLSTPFNTNWVRGTEMIVQAAGIGGASQTYTLYAPPDSPTTLETAENIGVLTDATVSFPDPTAAATPLARVWAAHDGLRLMAVGDPINPGRLYWTVAANPDSARDSDYIEVTDPSEPLLNGCAYEGADYVWSAQAMYRIEPSSGANAFAAYRLGLTYGMAGVWAFTDQGPALFFVGFDGVYEYSPAGGARNITAEDLWPLFPHENVPGVPVTVGAAGAQPLGAFTITPPDYTQPDRLRLSFADNQLFFDYADSGGIHRTLVYNYLTKGWIVYHYGPPAASLHFQQQGITNPATLVGTDDGSVYTVTADTTDGPGVPILCNVTTLADDQDESRARKQYGDLILDCVASGGGVRQQVFYDNYLVLAAASPAILNASRAQTIIDLTPNVDSLHRNIALFLGWFAADRVTLYEWQPSVIGKVEDSKLRATDWYDGGSLHLKWIHGLRIYCNTFGVAKSLLVQYDGGINGPIISITTGIPTVGESVAAISLPPVPGTSHPIKAHMIRLIPQDSVPWEFMTIELIANPEPELVSNWIAQPTTFDFTGYSHARDCQLAYATAPGTAATFTVILDPADPWGSSYTFPPFPDTGGSERKLYAPLPAMKGKLWQLIASGNVQVYERDCEFRVKQWGDTGPYRAAKPIGDLTRTEGGARI